MPRSIGPRPPPRHGNSFRSGRISLKDKDPKGSGERGGQRLQKIISQAGVASRRAAEKLIAEGRVTITGETVREMGTKGDLARDDIRVDGRRIKSAQRLRYILLYKPAGFVTTRSDPERRRTVVDLLESVREYVYPV